MNIKKVLNILYSILFFTVPLILWPYTSELFEFNKVVVVYILTVLIILFWAIRCQLEKKFVFKKTPLDIPLLLFLGSQIISTIISVDTRTSIFGYYSRFNGGLLSLISYSFLYWGYVSNMGRRDAMFHIKTIFTSTFLSSVYGILEHFGIDKNLWIQDVQNRVFSTFGQPNWMAAWLTAVIPISLSFSLLSFRTHFGIFGKDIKILNQVQDDKHRKVKIVKRVKLAVPFVLTIIFFTTLLFTKSRSGILGFGISIFIFWGLVLVSFLKDRQQSKKIFCSFVITNLILAVTVLIIGSPWTLSLSKIAEKRNSSIQSSISASDTKTLQAPALEVGGSSSVEIRRIVWKGALDVWKNYPLFGSGVETFAFSYYQFRPIEHNLVSEWDFLYNKAHNEYLNFMATTGSAGILTYIALITLMLIGFFKALNMKYGGQNSSEEQGLALHNEQSSKIDNETRFLNIGLLSGFVSILITNFFGFSVVPVNLLFFLFPAMAATLATRDKQQATRLLNVKSLSPEQKVLSSILLLIAFYLLLSISRYWYADVLYSRADLLSKSGDLINAVKTIDFAIKLSPKEAIYHNELASYFSDIALVYNSQENPEYARRFSKDAMTSINQAERYSPNNLNIMRNKARIAIRLSEIDNAYILDAKNTLIRALEIAPTEAKLWYNLSLVYYRIGDVDEAVKILQKTIGMKANYKDARYAYAVILIDNGKKDVAKEELEYILNNIDPNDEKTKSTLEELKFSED